MIYLWQDAALKKDEMNQHLQSILNIIQQDKTVAVDAKYAVLKSLKDAEKDLEITAAELAQTDKVAKAQKRELEIETALERVRARTMAMQKSDELGETAFVLFQQLKDLGEDPEQISIGIMNEAEDEQDAWMTINGKRSSRPVKISLNEPVVMRKLYAGWKERKKSLVIDISGRDLEDYNNYRNSIIDNKTDLSRTKDRRVISTAYFSRGNISLATPEPRPLQSIQLLERFAAVFEQAYTRFLDLQKAEAQTREAKIEAGLERVRSRTLAMHKSDELAETAAILIKQLNLLSIKPISLFIGIIKDNSCDIELLCTDETGKEINTHFRANINKNAYIKEIYDAWSAKEKSLVLDIHGSALEDWLAYCRDKLHLSFKSDEFLKRSVQNIAYFSKGFIAFSSANEHPPEIIQLLERFASVFNLTYIRFIDLQKAEALAKEALIESAKERVRSRAMAMQDSHELAELVGTIFKELTRLDFSVTGCFIWINNPESSTEELWVANEKSDKPPEAYFLKPFPHPYFRSILHAWKEKNKKWIYEMKGEEKEIFQKKLFEEIGNLPPEFKNALQTPDKVIFSASFNRFGALENVETKCLNDAQFEILHRLGRVFDLTYTRFLDLKHAEALAKEAKIEAALERVRSRTLAMQRSDELAETAEVLFTQLILLGIAPNSLYIAIIKDESGDLEFWRPDKNGNKISTRCLVKVKDNISILKMYEGWAAKKKSTVIDMQGKELDDWITYWNKEFNVPMIKGDAQRRVQNISYFSKGFITIASTDDQPEEATSLLDRFAAVFNLTYARFNDLKIAERHAKQAELDLIILQTEKKRAEDALSELKATQNLLIQTEKMASLGELTAGIAHEIQNPLNFVNNFSEVSIELLNEMENAILKSKREEILTISSDIKQNLEKINQHGRRADAIVKGMLQHSHNSSAIKEPTDINKLADQYLRLAYHGLRARDKSFIATMKTDFDESIGNINIISQDIGRVILNLITNAFYTVTEKNKASLCTSGQACSARLPYEPTVSVSTKKINDKVEISVKDNGTGIPQNVLDKIFQPFFTTKPTGQGTGLGLSLSYDIVKAHGGELKVETEEGIGSTFTVELPVT